MPRMIRLEDIGNNNQRNVSSLPAWSLIVEFHMEMIAERVIDCCCCHRSAGRFCHQLFPSTMFAAVHRQ